MERVIIDFELFNKLYFVDELSLRVVAEKMGTNHSTLRDHMKKNGVKSRSRGDAISLAIKKGRRDIKAENNPNFKHGIHNRLDNKSGIYFLYDDDDIVYIGKATRSMRERVASHTSSGKVFNKVIGYVINSDSDIHVAELYLINLHKPKYNSGDLGVDKMTIEFDVLAGITESVISIKI